MPLTVDGWTVVESKTYSKDLVRVVVGDGHGQRLSMLVPRSLTADEDLASLIRHRVAAHQPPGPEPLSGPG